MEANAPGTVATAQAVHSPAERAKPIEVLENLIATGTLHHATWRDKGTCWEGLVVYKRDPDGFRGYSPVATVRVDDADFDAAINIAGCVHIGRCGGG